MTHNPISDSLLGQHMLPGHVDGPRYGTRGTLGTGGAGHVALAMDREIHRVVALKTLQAGALAEPLDVYRFVEEARITAQLEHPNIVPVYDIGAGPDGQPFYTMRVVEKTSLRNVLHRDHTPQWPMVRLLGAFVQITRALAYAHARGVIHRDIKPENILLGDFGEVYLADWGLAKVMPKSKLTIHGEGSTPPPARMDGGGTPGYIAPEILRCAWHEVDERSDLFALGVILYELLTGTDPFRGGSVGQTLFATVEKTPRRPSEIARDCPLLLEDLCLALLAKNPADRPRTAEEVADCVEAFLEGAKEKERRKDEARKLCGRAAAPSERYRDLEKQRQKLTLRARALLQSIKGCEPVEKKLPAWRLEDLASHAERDGGLALAEAIELYTKALGYDAHSDEAHQGLADLYFSQARVAEEQRRSALQVYYEALVAEHDRGPYAALLHADAVLSVTSRAPARVTAQRYVERERRLVLDGATDLGETPVRAAHLPPGSYLLTVSAPGQTPARYPVLLVRGAHHEASITLFSPSAIGDGFVHVARGTVTLGGDPEAYDPIPRQEVMVDDFAIAEFPVTLRDYCAFLDHLQRVDPTMAKKRAPHDPEGTVGLLVRLGKDGAWAPDPTIMEGEARKLFPPEDGHLWRVPVLMIDWFDAVAFAAFASARDGCAYRLPTEAEWEKAARGTDGRFYPWGDRFDPTFCHMRESRPFLQQPEPRGSFATDVSPYGVRDMAGGMREWVGDVFGERTAAELASEREPPVGSARADSGWRQVRSGMWNADHKWARSSSRGGAFALQRGTGLSFRLAKSL